ncbi:MAG: PIG-L family deacetylase [Candidatus Levybacteria bacterium]|nr:PIG-L family deacetylase [Candidatus Levybacteria bacterium]
MREFETLHAIVDEKKLELPDQALVVVAHHDDEKMWNMQSHLAQRGVGLTVLVLTDSSGRDLKGYTPERLAKARWTEGTASAQEAGLAGLHRIGLPDGQLSSYIDYAIEFGEQFIDDKAVVFAPNYGDEHPDHVAANIVAQKLAGDATPLYEMDTLTGYDQYGNVLVPTEKDIYQPLSTRTARKEKKIYKELNPTQTKNIPWHQRKAMFDALGMTSRRGRERGIPHAAVLFKANNAINDPTRKWLQRSVA